MIVVRVVLSCWPFTITLIFCLFIDRTIWTNDRTVAIFIQEYRRTNGRRRARWNSRDLQRPRRVISGLFARNSRSFEWSHRDDMFHCSRLFGISIVYTPTCSIDSKRKEKEKIEERKEKTRKVRDKCAINDNTVLFSSLLLDACIVPVSVPVCHLDSRQLQQPPPSLMNNQQHQLQHQNNPPHLAYQQANHHSYTTVTTSNQHGPSHLPPGGGVMGAHQQGPVLPHLQQQVSPLLFREFLRALSLSLSSHSLSLSLVCFCRTCVLFIHTFCALFL